MEIIRRTIGFAAICLAAANLQGQPSDTKPEKVYRIIYRQESSEWYASQAVLWRREVDRDPSRPDAWYNYYLASEYAHRQGSESVKKRVLAGIISDMEKRIPNSYEHYLAENRFDHSDIAALKKAHELKPPLAEPLYGLIVDSHINGKWAEARSLLLSLYETRDVAPGLLNYNYNVLMSTERNALLFTNGDNDTYPVWVLQAAKDVRPDVTVVNAHLVQAYPEYLERLLREKQIEISAGTLSDLSASEFIAALCAQVTSGHPDIPIYFALTLSPVYIDRLRDQLYVTGLVFQYSDRQLDNIAILERNIDKNFRLDYLSHDWYNEDFVASETVRRNLDQNYISPFLMLASHYKISGQVSQLRYWVDLASRLARQSDSRKWLEYIESNFSSE